MSPISKGLASFAVAAVLSTAAAAQGLVTQKNIPLATALGGIYAGLSPYS